MIAGRWPVPFPVQVIGLKSLEVTAVRVKRGKTLLRKMPAEADPLARLLVFEDF